MAAATAMARRRWPCTKESEVSHERASAAGPAAEPQRQGPWRPERQERDPKAGKPAPGNLEQQGRQGDVHENTHNQGYQQDR
jgi:hypothetical protein